MYLEIKKNKNYKDNISKLKELTSDIEIREYGKSTYLNSDFLDSFVTRETYTNKLNLRVGLCGKKEYNVIISMNDILSIYAL